MMATSQIKVERTAKDKEEAHGLVKTALEQNRAIGIFPEGTRSPDDEIQKPFTGVARYAISHRVKVLPVGIIDTFKVMARHHAIPRFKKVVQIHVGNPIEFTEFHKENCTPKEYEEATHRIMLEVAKLAKKDYRHHLYE